MNENDFTIPEETNSEVMFVKGIYLIDLLIIFGCWVFFSMFSELVHPVLSIPFNAFPLLFGIVITRKTSDNPGKRLYFSIFCRLIKDFQPQIFHNIEKDAVDADKQSIQSFLER